MISQNANDCDQAKSCGECISTENCFWCSESTYDTSYNGKCCPLSDQEKCTKIENPNSYMNEIQNEDISLGEELHGFPQIFH